MLTFRARETNVPCPTKPREKTRRIGLSEPGAPARLSLGAGPSETSCEYARALAGACDLGPTWDVDFLPAHDSPIHPAVDWARSGAMALTGAHDGAPRLVRGPLASAMHGVTHFLERLVPGSALASLDGPALLGERAALVGLSRRGAQSAGGSARILATRSGSLALNLPRPDDWRLMPAWLEVDLDLTTPPADSDEDANWQSLSRVLSERDSEALVERGRLMGLAVAAATRSPVANTPFFRLHHVSEVGRPQLVPNRRLRLFDLSTLWAGPLAASLLASVGIDVLKVENPARPDGARSGPKHFFDLMNGTKRSCALDLRDTLDRQCFERLLSSADIVIESARPRALAQLGYDPASWVTEKPGRLWASITGYGRDHEWIAFGDDAAVAAGLAWSPVASERDACFCADAIADPMTGLHTAAILLAHLRAGRGGLLDISLHDIASRAATAPHAGLILSVEREAENWFVASDDGPVLVEAPRARKVGATATPLAPPDAALLDTWANDSC